MKNANKKTANNAATKRKILVVCAILYVNVERERDTHKLPASARHGINKCDMKHENKTQFTIDSKFDCKFNLLCLASMVFIRPLRILRI